MIAVILAGGKGTRLAPFTTSLPKPLVPVGERPILEIVINNLKKSGVTKIIIAVNHMAQLIESFFGDGSKYGVEIEYSLESEPLSTVAPIKLIKGLPDNFIVMNGDILTDLNFKSFFDLHINKKELITVGVFERETRIDYGVINFDDSMKLLGFEEKPIRKFNVSMGIYVFQKKILDIVPDKGAFGFDDLMTKMIENKMSINIYKHTGKWLDIGRPEDYDYANNM